MPRKSVQSITLDSNLRCNKIYPMKDTKKKIDELKTIGISVSRKQAIHLARALLAASQEWDKIDITGRRFEKRKSDDTYSLTVTSFIKE